MDFVSLNSAIVRIDTGELHVFAEIVAAIIAEEAFLTWNTRLDSHSFT